MEEMNHLSTDELWLGILLMLMCADNEPREEVLKRFGRLNIEPPVSDGSGD